MAVGTRKPIIQCDDCGESFQRNIQEYPMANDGVRQALICPSCKRQYPICVITPLGVKLRERLSRMRRIQRANDQLPGAEYQDMLERYRLQVTLLSAGERRERAVAEAKQGAEQSMKQGVRS